MRDLDFSNLEPLSRPVPQRRPWVVPVLIAALLAGVFAGLGWSDDFECQLEAGCKALWPGHGPGGSTATVVFKRGEIIGTSGGWIVNPADGWRRVDFNEAIAGLLPGCAP